MKIRVPALFCFLLTSIHFSYGMQGDGKEEIACPDADGEGKIPCLNPGCLKTVSLITLEDGRKIVFGDHGDHFVCTNTDNKHRLVERARYIEPPKFRELPDKVSPKEVVFVFGGVHMSPKEAYEYAKEKTRMGDPEHATSAGCPRHAGHTVFNLDPKTHPNHEVDFTAEGLIEKLALVGKADVVVLENLGSDILLSAILNSYKALKVGGRVIAYPAPGFAELMFKLAGFKDIAKHEGEYCDPYAFRTIPGAVGVVTAVKAELRDEDEEEESE